MGEKRERKERGKRKEESFRERSSTFSLEFSVIGPVNSGEVRSKVGPHCKSYAWVAVLGEFQQIPGGRGFLLLVLFFG